MSTVAAAITELRNRADRVLKTMQQSGFAPTGVKTNDVRYTVKDVADLIGRSTTAIREAEESGRAPAPDLGENSRRLGYTQPQISKLRSVFGTLPYRDPEDPPVVLAVSSFKGGVGKSTTSIHLGQYLALRGYRVLMVDCDPQATTTALFGYVPDLDIPEDETLLTFYRNEQPALDYAIRETYWDGMDLIPANLGLYQAEYEWMANVDRTTFEFLHRGIRSVDRAYDVVILDPPPSLGLMALNVMWAANAVLIPVPAQFPDLSSAVTYLRMLENVMSTMEKRLGEREFLFVKALITRFDEGVEGKSTQSNLAQIYGAIFGDMLLRHKLRQTKAIENAFALQRTVYEMSRDDVTRSVQRRALNILDGVFEEVELLIRQCWPSHQKALREQGLV